MSGTPNTTTRPERPRLAVVAPVYNERETIDQFVSRAAAALERVEGAEWTLILVDDGSTDGSAERIHELRIDEPRVALVSLSRNFGHQAALSAGLDAAEGDAVVLIDADLQDPPELIPEMVHAWRRGAEVVLAERRSRQETGLRALGFAAFHRFFRLITDFPIPADTGVFGLLDRRAADQLRRLSERNRFLPGSAPGSASAPRPFTTTAPSAPPETPSRPSPGSSATPWTASSASPTSRSAS